MKRVNRERQRGERARIEERLKGWVVAAQGGEGEEAEHLLVTLSNCNHLARKKRMSMDDDSIRSQQKQKKWRPGGMEKRLRQQEEKEEEEKVVVMLVLSIDIPCSCETCRTRLLPARFVCLWTFFFFRLISNKIF